MNTLKLLSFGILAASIYAQHPLLAADKKGRSSKKDAVKIDSSDHRLPIERKAEA